MSRKIWVNAAQYILVSGVRLYQLLASPVLRVVFGPLARCRFEPSCSTYAIKALQTHGALAGTWLAMKRIGRCQPWGGCGHDPVPNRKSEGRGSVSFVKSTGNVKKIETEPNFEQRRIISTAVDSLAAQ